MKNNKWLILFKRLFFPIIIMIFTSIIITSITELIPYKVLFIKIDFEAIHSKILIRLIIFFALLFIFRSIYIKYNSKNKELIPTSVYGDLPYTFYYLASIILGIKKINLKSKPIQLQFKIYNNISYFEIIEDKEIPIDDKTKYIIEDNKFKTNTINLLIGDTYRISINQIPTILKNNRTIIINRKNKNDKNRINSNELIKIISNIIQENKSTCKVYNLFLYTNPITNRRIYEKFNTCRDGFTINIFKCNNKFIFEDKGKVSLKL